jgi:hypothetical protein
VTVVVDESGGSSLRATKDVKLMLSQFHVYIDDLNPARREVIRTMRYCVCEHTVNIYQPVDKSENPQDYAAIG